MNWTYDRDYEWKKNSKKCENTKKSIQSPINIDTSLINNEDKFRTIHMCDSKCKLSINYKPSGCHVINEFNTPTVYFDCGSFIRYNGHIDDVEKTKDGEIVNKINENEIFELHKMTIHTPSMHTINSMKYDVELNLYHYSLGDMLESTTINFINNDKNNNNEDTCKYSNKLKGRKGDSLQPKISPEEGKKGVIISLLLKIGEDNGSINDFFSQIINKIPLQASRPEDAKEIEVPVDEDWGAKLLLPKDKAFFSYNGSLPVPPCEEYWHWVVFEEIGEISNLFFETLNLGFRNNIRSVQKINYGKMIIKYNNNPKFDKENELEIKNMTKTIQKYQKKINNLRNKGNVKIKSRSGNLYDNLFKKSNVSNQSSKECASNNNNNNNNNNSTKSLLTDEKWYIKHKKTIKYSIIFITFLLFVLSAVSITRFVIVSGLLPQLIANRVEYEKIGKSSTTSDKNDTNNENNNTNNNND